MNRCVTLSSFTKIAYFTKYQNKQFMFVTSSLDEFMMPWNTQYFWRDLNIQTNNKAFLR